eukprot:gene771-414_t
MGRAGPVLAGRHAQRTAPGRVSPAHLLQAASAATHKAHRRIPFFLSKYSTIPSTLIGKGEGGTVHTLSNIPPGQSSAAALVWESSPFNWKRKPHRTPQRHPSTVGTRRTIKAFEKGIHMGIDRRVHIYPERAVRSPAPMQMFSHP